MKWFRRPKVYPALDREEIIRTTLRHYLVDDPCEAAWFAMALRKLLPEWGVL